MSDKTEDKKQYTVDILIRKDVAATVTLQALSKEQAEEMAMRLVKTKAHKA